MPRINVALMSFLSLVLVNSRNPFSRHRVEAETRRTAGLTGGSCDIISTRQTDRGVRTSVK